MTDLEKRLEDLQSRHLELSKSYKSLQQEYSYVKADLDLLREDNLRLEKQRTESIAAYNSELIQSQEPSYDPVLFQTLDCCSDEYEESTRCW
jgi:chromosome segregation ATPase